MDGLMELDVYIVRIALVQYILNILSNEYDIALPSSLQRHKI